MAKVKHRGVEKSEELDDSQLRPETRPLLVRSRQFFSTTDGVIAMMMVLPFLALALVKMPMSGEIIFVTMLLFYSVFVNPGHNDPKKKSGRRIRYDFPYRVPFYAKLFDGSVPGYELGKGITLLGKEDSSNLEIWTGDSDARTHQLVLGTTGSGKTEMLLGLVYNALVQNSGFIYTDGKGDTSLWNNVFRLARYLGREDDLVVINFLTSGRDFLDKQEDRTTNTMNPFALGSSGMLIELIIALMDDSGGGGDMWKGRAIAFVSGLTRVLVFLRDRGYLLLDAKKFIENFDLPVLERLVWDSTLTEGGRDVQIKDELFSKVLEPLKAYIMTLPGYSKENKGAQEQKTVEQHGFITMQLTRLFGDMSFTYGYIFQTALGEVDMYDVILNRRILVVLLPALERAPDSLKMLGKLIVGAIKQMMAGCLGNRLEGSVRDIITSRPNNARTAFYVVLDEYGYYAVLGFAVAPAQARSLGISITFAAQDFSSLQKSSKEEADATWENTNVRAIGRLTSGKESETFRRVNGLAGEAKINEISRKDYEAGAVMSGYRTVRDTSIARVSRLEFDDLAKQENGEFTFFVGKKDKKGGGGISVIRGRTFYTQVAESEAPTHIRVNHFLRIEPPRLNVGDQDMEIVEELEKAVKKALLNGSWKKIFPDVPTAMVKPNQKAQLLQLGEFARDAQYSQKLSLGEALRVAFIGLEKEASIVQAESLRKIEADRQSRATPVEDGVLRESVETINEAVLMPDEQESGFSAEMLNGGSAPLPVAVAADVEDFSDEKIDDSDFDFGDALTPPAKAVTTLAIDGEPADPFAENTDKEDGDAQGASDSGGASTQTDSGAGGETKADESGASGDGGTKAGGKAGSGTGSGGVGAALVLSLENQPAAASSTDVAAPLAGGVVVENVLRLLSDERRDLQDGRYVTVDGEMVKEVMKAFFSDADIESPSVRNTVPVPAPASPAFRSASLLTQRTIGDEAEFPPTEQSRYLASRLSDLDTFVSGKEDLLEIKRDAKDTVERLEKVTSYVNTATKPEPATLKAVDMNIESLVQLALSAAENNASDYR